MDEMTATIEATAEEVVSQLADLCDVKEILSLLVGTVGAQAVIDSLPFALAGHDETDDNDDLPLM